jgi:hypothetical protein
LLGLLAEGQAMGKDYILKLMPISPIGIFENLLFEEDVAEVHLNIFPVYVAEPALFFI